MNRNNGSDHISRETLIKLQHLPHLMDKAFIIPGTNIRFGFDSVVGLIPLLGDIFDIAFKANSKNARIIMTHVERQIESDTIDVDYERTA